MKNKYVGSPYSRSEMYAGRIACCPLVTDRQTDGLMPGDNITLFVSRGQRDKICWMRFNDFNMAIICMTRLWTMTKVVG